MATRINGKPYIYATWLAKLLGGHECLWSAWFKAHYRYQKHELQAGDLVQWNRDHNDMMRTRRAELEREGYHVTAERENEFKIELPHAIVAGKPDLVGVKPASTLIVDGKTGRERESDVWQVLIYLWARLKVKPDTNLDTLEGEVHYKRGDVRITVTPSEFTEERREQVNALLLTIASPMPPRRVPSRFECQVCNIGPADCAARFKAEHSTAVAAEF